MEQTNDHNPIIGTITGTLLTVAVNIATEDIFKTAVLAIIGAVVSFSVSHFLKWVVKKMKK